MYKMLIAVPEGYFADCLLQESSKEYLSITCHRGDELPPLLAIFRPDILILDFSLPYIDGLTALLHSEYTPPVLLALTVYWNDEIEEIAQIAGVDRAIMLPRSIDFIMSQLQLLINGKIHKKSPSLDH